MLLTHGHADSVFGLDDLRTWTLRGDPIDIYLSAETLAVVSAAFPYLVDKGQATGGGDVASLRFEVFEYDDVLDLWGLQVRIIPIPHGRQPDGSVFLFCGFRFGDQVAYVSDASEVTPDARERMSGCDIIVLDALGRRNHPSHLTIDASFDEMTLMAPAMGVMTGFGHSVDHDELVDWLAEKNEEKPHSIIAGYDGLRIALDELNCCEPYRSHSHPSLQQQQGGET